MIGIRGSLDAVRSIGWSFSSSTFQIPWSRISGQATQWVDNVLILDHNLIVTRFDHHGKTGEG